MQITLVRAEQRRNPLWCIRKYEEKKVFISDIERESEAKKESGIPCWDSKLKIFIRMIAESSRLVELFFRPRTRAAFVSIVTLCSRLTAEELIAHWESMPLTSLTILTETGEAKKLLNEASKKKRSVEQKCTSRGRRAGEWIAINHHRPDFDIAFDCRSSA